MYSRACFLLGGPNEADTLDIWWWARFERALCKENDCYSIKTGNGQSTDKSLGYRSRCPVEASMGFKRLLQYNYSNHEQQCEEENAQTDNRFQQMKVLMLSMRKDFEGGDYVWPNISSVWAKIHSTECDRYLSRCYSEIYNMLW